jgi:hypothetical protein
MPCLALAVFMTLLSACTTIGNKFDPSLVNELTPGVSTMADARHSLGPPSAMSTYPDGRQLLQWQYSQGTIIGASGAHVAILFDSDGKMMRVTHRFEQ